MQVELAGEKLMLSPNKAMFWISERKLIVSDLHLGKVSHFRRNGISVPTQARFSNLIQLELLIREFEPQSVLFLGDLFHSNYNLEWDEFGRFIQAFEQVDFELVEGNHDIMHPKHYQKYQIKVYANGLISGPFIFTHIPLDQHGHHYNLSGHIHPGVRLTGKGRQSLKLPCFYFGEHSGILPAFGDFTGKFMLKPNRKDRIYVVTGQQVIDMSAEKK